jgi:quercetin dioxygenase-like cupin family protein
MTIYHTAAKDDDIVADDHTATLHEHILNNALSCALNDVSGLNNHSTLHEIFHDSTHALLQSPTYLRKEYATMVWTMSHLPNTLPLLAPPNGIRERILAAIRADASLQRNHNAPVSQETHPPHNEYISNIAERTADLYSIENSDTQGWLPHPIEGITVKPLATDRSRGYAMLLMRLDKGVHYPSHTHDGDEQCFVVNGEITISGESLGSGDFFSTRKGADHGTISTANGATVMLTVALEDYRKSAWKIGVSIVKQRLRRVFAYMI